MCLLLYCLGQGQCGVRTRFKVRVRAKPVR